MPRKSSRHLRLVPLLPEDCGAVWHWVASNGRPVACPRCGSRDTVNRFDVYAPGNDNNGRRPLRDGGRV